MRACKAKVEKLLQDTNEVHYWIGFLLADGYFSQSRMRGDSSIKDEDHLKRLGDLLEMEGELGRTNKSVYLAAQHRKYVPLLKKKFDIKMRKTYHPPCFGLYELMSNDHFVSLLVGFIDGDGRIVKQFERDDARIDIKVHGSWLSWLNGAAMKLNSIVGADACGASLTKEGYARWTISDSKLVNFLKRKTRELSLPVLLRKWKEINEDFVSLRRLAEERKEKVLALAGKGLRPVDISRETGMKYTTVYQIIRRNNNA